MTKLFHVDFEHTISFDDGSSTVLVLEDTKQFRKYISELYSSFDGDGPFHLVDGIKEKKFKDHLEIILSPFSVSFFRKKTYCEASSPHERTYGIRKPLR